MSDFQVVPVGPQPSTFAEPTGLRERFRVTVLMRGGLLLGAVVALGIVAAGMSLAQPATVVAFREIPSLEMAFALVSAVCTFTAVFIVPLLLPVDELRSATTLCALQSPPPTKETVCGRLCTRAVISGAMSEVAALLAFILLAMGADPPVYLALFAVTLLSSALTFPRWNVWEAAVVGAEDDELPSLG